MDIDDIFSAFSDSFIMNDIPERGKKFITGGIHYVVVGKGVVSGYFRCKCIHDMEGQDWDKLPEVWL